jgi:tetratricopeptide (TPR) repeat protein
MNRIYRETEIIILHEIAIFYKLLGKLDKACVFYENLIKYFERADMVNDTKPIYLIYIGYSNILGVMGEHEKSMEICFKAIKRGLAENKMNYLYNFYYNIGCSLQIKGNDEEKRLAKLYIWTAEEAIELEKGVEHTLTLNVNTTVRLAAKMARNWATGQLIDRN